MTLSLLISAAVAGLLSFFSPCVLPLLPVYVGMLTTDADKSLNLAARVARTVAFILGISCVFVVLGLGAAALGGIANNVYVNLVLGLVIFLFGLYLAGVLRVGFLGREHRKNMNGYQVTGVASAFLLGLAFSFGWTPCVGPILGSILALAASTGSSAEGAILLLVYALGLCVPFVVLTVATTFVMSRLKKLYKYLPIVQKIGGALIALMGVWMIANQVNTLVQLKNAQEQSALVAAAQNTDQAGEKDVSGVSSAWKNVVLLDREGNKHRLSEFKGRPLYFEFWGTWCTNCVEDLDQFTKVYKEHEQAGDVQITSVVVPNNFGELPPDGVVKWLDEHKVDVPVLMDTNASLANYLGISGFPTSVFVDSEGNIVKVRVGAMSVEDLEAELAKLS